MSRVIDLSTFKNQRASLQGGNLTELLKKATVLQKNLEEFKETIVVLDFNGLKHAFEARLANLILKTKNIGPDFFLCGSYVATLLTEIGSTMPESWYAADYFLKAADDGNPDALKQGANVCFLIYAVFPLRGQVRAMKLSNYEALGRGLYYNYYGQTGTIVAYFMSQQFKPMAEIAQECFRQLK